MKKEQLKQLAADMLAGGMSVTDAKAALIRLDPNSSKQIKKFMKDPSFTNKYTIDVSSDEDDDIVERTVINGVEDVVAEQLESAAAIGAEETGKLLEAVGQSIVDSLRKLIEAKENGAEEEPKAEAVPVEVVIPEEPKKKGFNFEGFDDINNLMDPEWVKRQPFSTYTVRHPDLMCTSYTIHGPLYTGSFKNTHVPAIYVKSSFDRVLGKIFKGVESIEI